MTNNAYAFALTIQESYAGLDQIRIYVLTDRQARAKNFKPREVNGKTVKLEVMDTERLHRHWSEANPAANWRLLRNLKLAVPTARKITKTDLAKFLNAWDQMPDSVSLGSQKNFMKFMDRVTANDGNGALPPLPDVQAFKKMIARAILFKTTQKLVRPMFTAFQANVAAYVVSLVANRLGGKLDLEKVWLRQDISPQLKVQIQTWAVEVNMVLHETSQGRMISEWAKKRECWDAVRMAAYSAPVLDIPEIR